jgi:hypothetical protein
VKTRRAEHMAKRSGGSDEQPLGTLAGPLANRLAIALTIGANFLKIRANDHLGENRRKKAVSVGRMERTGRSSTPSTRRLLGC